MSSYPKIGTNLLVYATPVGQNLAAAQAPVGSFNANYYGLRMGSPIAQSFYTPGVGVQFFPNPQNSLVQVALPFNSVQATAYDRQNGVLVQFDVGGALRVVSISNSGAVASRVIPFSKQLQAVLKNIMPTWSAGQPLGYSGPAGVMAWISGSRYSVSLLYNPIAGGFAPGAMIGMDSVGAPLIIQPPGKNEFDFISAQNINAGIRTNIYTGFTTYGPATNSEICYGPLFGGYFVVGASALNTQGAFYTVDFNTMHPLVDLNGNLDFSQFTNNWLGGMTQAYGPNQLCIAQPPGALPASKYNTMYTISLANAALQSPAFAGLSCGCSA